MIHLFLVSVIWGFSFGIIKHNLEGLDSSFIAFARLLISFLVFIPFLKLKSIKPGFFSALLLTGALQYGVMYLCYIEAFRYLAAYEVALYTVLTPLYVVIFYNCMTGKANLVFLLSAVLAVLGSFILYYRLVHLPESILGFLLVQISNLAFAFGQIRYKLLKIDHSEIKQHQIFGILYLGGLTVAAIPFVSKGVIPSLTTQQVISLIYLGLLPSAGCFFLWNYGARKTNAGNLSVFNNLKIPIAILISFIFFGEKVNPFALAAGSSILLIALLINRFGVTLGRFNIKHSRAEN